MVQITIQNSVALGNNSTVSSSNEVSVGSATQQRKITNVADGNVSATSTDAITGKQLYRVIQNSGALGIENLRNEVNEKIDDVKNEVQLLQDYTLYNMILKLLHKLWLH